MKRILCLLVTFALMLSMTVPALAVGHQKLSDLSDEELAAFLENSGVEIPGTATEEISWTVFIREIVESVEKNPSVQFIFGYSTALDFANQIKTAVNAYYGAADAGGYAVSRASEGLLYSTVYGEWTPEYLSYNCYGYAIDYYDFISPGQIEWMSYGNEASDYNYNWLANACTVAS